MYCINCGKEIDGNIPICGECLQSVLDRHQEKQNILTKVDLTAEAFSIKEIDTPEIAEPTSETPQNDYDKEITSFIVAIMAIITITTIIIVIAAYF